MEIFLNIEGIEPAIRRLTALGMAIPGTVHDTCLEWSNKVLAQAKELVPIDTSALQESGHVEDWSVGGVANWKSINMFIAFGGLTSIQFVDYAVFVHEDLQAHHPHGQAKFLEQPWESGIPELWQRLGNAMEGILR